MDPRPLPTLINLALHQVLGAHPVFAHDTLDLILDNTKQLNNIAARALLSLNHDHCHDATKFLEQIAKATNYDP